MILGYSQYYPWGGETPFESKILSGEKVHTIRKDLKGRWKAGNTIQHSTGVRTKKFNQFAKGGCISIESINITFSELGKIETVFIDGVEINNWDVIAKNDGLSILDFEKWFYTNSHHGIFKGKIIHWTNKKYVRI